MTILNTKFRGLKVIKGTNYYETGDILERFLKIIFLRTKSLSFGLYPNQRKKWLEVYTYRKKFSKI